ncbi:capsid protein [Sporobolus striate mosaic virus 2]|uniref:Capsid protein n=1 Tax=Sporobolus striate mosaic virus 2 TaxID=1302850 RepID=J7FHN2_9GEMI|nr:capsid protein [Sporobolus striate mosaic virus 2]AFN80718.1 capsid protein [Sporobolus striate mosaic virus 2]
MPPPAKKKKGSDSGAGGSRSVYQRRYYGPRSSSGRAVRRPPLQFIQYTWTSNGSPITVGPNGYVALLTSFPRGSDEDKRHTGETVTYKVGLDLFCVRDTNRYKEIGSAIHCCWLVYDAQPTGTIPGLGTIFDLVDNFTEYPTTWKVNRDMGHRFVIKRRWTFTLQSDGHLGSNDYSRAPAAPCKYMIAFNKFVKRLGVRTEWRNTTTGDIGDVSRGALYIVMARGNAWSYEVRGRIRVYFKSVGNQ